MNEKIASELSKDLVIKINQISDTLEKGMYASDLRIFFAEHRISYSIHVISILIEHEYLHVKVVFIV